MPQKRQQDLNDTASKDSHRESKNSYFQNSFWNGTDKRGHMHDVWTEKCDIIKECTQPTEELIRHDKATDHCVKITVLQAAAPWRLTENNQRFKGAYCLHHHGDKHFWNVNHCLPHCKAEASQNTTILILVAMRTWGVGLFGSLAQAKYENTAAHYVLGWFLSKTKNIKLWHLWT
jgi:hypothetical protein